MNTLKRYYLKLFKNIHIGDNVNIRRNTNFELPLWLVFNKNGKRVRRNIKGGIIIKNDVDIGGNCSIVYGVEKPTLIEENVWIAHNSVIGHDTIIRRGTVIVSGVIINGCCEIDEYSFISSGVTIKPNIKIGKNTLIGLGSNVTKDIPDNVIAYGNPCKIIKQNEWRRPQ